MLTVHAVKRKGGGVAIVLINKHPNQTFEVNLNIPDGSLAATATRYDFGRANFTANSTWPPPLQRGPDWTGWEAASRSRFPQPRKAS